MNAVRIPLATLDARASEEQLPGVKRPSIILIRAVVGLAVVIVLAQLAATPASGAPRPQLVLTPAVGPPTTAVETNGSGFRRERSSRSTSTRRAGSAIARGRLRKHRAHVRRTPNSPAGRHTR